MHLWVVELLQCTATLPATSRRWKSSNALPKLYGGVGHWNSCNSPPHCLWVVGTKTLAMHYHTAWEQWAMELL